MLHARRIVARDGISVADVACRHGRGRGRDVEESPGHAIVFVRRGCFVRSADGVETLLDPTTAYCLSPGAEERYDHPHERGDDCTAVGLAAGVVASILGGETELPGAPVHVTPQLDLAHRVLVARARRGDDDHAVVEDAVVLCAAALEQARPAQVAAGRPATQRSHQALADGVREALVEDPGRSLHDLARLTAVSPHHLSRVFRATTGATVSGHRLRLRARDALERLGDGEDDLARLATEVGFADQSHLTRVLRSEIGRTPAALRRVLATSA